MKKKKNKKKDKEKDLSAYTFSDPATKKKIRKHLSDIRDEITEEDIKNVKIPGETTADPLTADKNGLEYDRDLEGLSDIKKKEDDNEKMTPWNILEG